MGIAILTSVTLIGLILLIWFKTEAFVEYCELFKIGKLFKVDQLKEIGFEGDYLSFLKEYYDNFFTRLITCPICLGVWLGIIQVPILSVILNPLVAILLYPVITFFGLFFYLTISKLL